MGDEVKFSKRKVKVRPFVLKLNTDEDQIYFVKINGGLNQVNLTLVSQKQMLVKEGEDNQLYGIFLELLFQWFFITCLSFSQQRAIVTFFISSMSFAMGFF